MAQDGRPIVQLFTDGACSGNPGPGGWAFILRHPASGAEIERSGGEAETTNNRMELRAVIEGLSKLREPSVVEVWSDSQYVLKGLDEWLAGWIAKGWVNSAKKPVKNRDLWEQLDRLRRTHELRYHWIRGHSEHEENERCDRLATAEARRIRDGR